VSAPLKSESPGEPTAAAPEDERFPNLRRTAASLGMDPEMVNRAFTQLDARRESYAERDAIQLEPPPDDGAPPPLDDVDALHAASAVQFSSLSEVCASEVGPKVPLIRDLLFPGAWLLVGRPKIGKSWLLLQLALAFAENASFLAYACAVPDAEVLCIFAEDDDSRIKSRLEALGVARAPSTCYVVNQSALRDLAARFADQLTFVEFLELWLAAHSKVRLVLIDTETTVRQVWAGCAAATERSSRVVETDYHQTRAFDELALRRRLAIILVNHARKLKSGEWHDIHELINRSNTALAGASGSIAFADPPDADRFNPKQKTRVLGIRGRDLKEDVLLAVHQREEMPYFVSDGEYAEVRQTQVEQQLLEALEELTAEAGAEEYISAEDLASAVGKTRGTVKRAMTRMLSKGRTHWKKARVVVKRGKGGGYRLEPMETAA
jgi:AAA domain